jgi:hypothetical protein
MNDRFSEQQFPQGPASQPLDPEGQWMSFVKWLHADEGINTASPCLQLKY